MMNEYQRVWAHVRGGDYGVSSAYEDRAACVKKYAWAIPNEAALYAIERVGPIVEVGAGNGYWASLLRARGVDVVAYDAEPYTGGGYCDGTKWTEVLQGGPEVAAHHHLRTLFICWPPYDDPFAYDALRAYTGRTLVYVGEYRYGCTGDDAFHEELDTKWLSQELVHLPKWAGIHDCLWVYTRRL